MEQFEFDFELVFPKLLDNGKIKEKFDVLVFVTGAIPSGETRMASLQGRNSERDLSDIPAEYRDWIGSVTTQTTIPKLIEFLNDGGTIVAIGSSTNIAEHVYLPIYDHIIDGNGNSLSSDKYYIPASILEVRVDNTLPVAYGLQDRVDIFFDNSPVFRLKPEADKAGVKSVAWFDSDQPLRSGWAWGQDRLYGGVAIAEAPVGKGKLFLFGPEVLYRAQSHGTFKLFFNSLYLGRATEVDKVK
jgi:hypothetical protein